MRAGHASTDFWIVNHECERERAVCLFSFAIAKGLVHEACSTWTAHLDLMHPSSFGVTCGPQCQLLLGARREERATPSQQLRRQLLHRAHALAARRGVKVRRLIHHPRPNHALAMHRGHKASQLPCQLLHPNHALAKQPGDEILRDPSSHIILCYHPTPPTPPTHRTHRTHQTHQTHQTHRARPILPSRPSLILMIKPHPKHPTLTIWTFSMHPTPIIQTRLTHPVHPTHPITNTKILLTRSAPMRLGQPARIARFAKAQMMCPATRLQRRPT